jgi:hypothetical protein
VSVDSETLIPQMITAHVGKTQLASSFEQQDVFAGLG